MPRTKQEPREIILDAPATPANPSREYLEWMLDGLMFLERLINPEVIGEGPCHHAGDSSLEKEAIKGSF